MSEEADRVGPELVVVKLLVTEDADAGDEDTAPPEDTIAVVVEAEADVDDECEGAGVEVIDDVIEIVVVVVLVVVDDDDLDCDVDEEEAEDVDVTKVFVLQEKLVPVDDAEVDVDAGAMTDTVSERPFVTYAYPLDGSNATVCEVGSTQA